MDITPKPFHELYGTCHCPKYTHLLQKIVEAVGDLLHIGHVEPLSRTSERAPTSFPVPLRRDMGWDGMLE